MSERPETTCGFTQRRARRAHRCRDCGGLIHSGDTYIQDCYMALYGEGARYCHACATVREEAERSWNAAWDKLHSIAPYHGESA